MFLLRLRKIIFTYALLSGGLSYRGFTLIFCSTVGVNKLYISAEINRRRLRPGMPNDALINTVTVSSPSTDVYTVTLNPFDCGNQFPLFELTHGTVSSSDSLALPLNTRIRG